MNTLPLSKLKAYALAHADQTFDLDSPYHCLACQTANSEKPGVHTMEGFSTFRIRPFGGYEAVDERYAQFSRCVLRTLTGRTLAAAIARLEAGEHPVQVAQDILGNHYV